MVRTATFRWTATPYVSDVEQLAIPDEFEQRRREDPMIESFFARGVREPFFVKNRSKPATYSTCR